MAQLQDSTFKYTDTTLTSFVVKPYTANGPTTPASSILYSNPDGVSAVTANTSLVFYGKGTPFYGDIIQNNILHLLEHFSSKTRPQYPTIGQVWYKKADYTDSLFPSDPTTRGLYVWSGSSWDAIVMAGTTSSELNLGGSKIRNVGDAANDTDAVNRRTGDARYVRVTGGSMAGAFTLTAGSITLNAGTRLAINTNPSLPTDAINLQFVNNLANVFTNQINAVNTRVDGITGASGSITTSGGTFSGTVTLSNTSTLIAQSGGPAFQLNGRAIKSIAVTPSDDDEASSKKYVDDRISTLAATVTANAGNVTTLAATIDTTYVRNDGGTMTGQLSLSSTSNLTLIAGGTANFGTRRLQNVGAPTFTTDAATKKYVDDTVSQKVKRQVVKQTASGTVAFTLPDSLVYRVDRNKLQVFVDGAKKTLDSRGFSTIKFSDAGGLTTASALGITAGTYAVTVTIDGTPKVLSVTTTSTTTFATLVTLLNAAAATASAAVVFTLDNYSTTALEIVASSNTSGASSSVTVSYATGELFKVITTSFAPVSTAGAAYDYKEVGTPQNTSTSVLFNTAPADNAVIEFLVFA